MKFAVTPLVLNPFVPCRTLQAEAGTAGAVGSASGGQGWLLGDARAKLREGA